MSEISRNKKLCPFRKNVYKDETSETQMFAPCLGESCMAALKLHGVKYNEWPYICLFMRGVNGGE